MATRAMIVLNFSGVNVTGIELSVSANTHLPPMLADSRTIARMPKECVVPQRIVEPQKY